MVDEAVPGVAAVIDDVVVVMEHTIGEPVVAHELPDILHHVQFRAFRRQRQQRDVFRHGEVAGHVPARLIEQQHGVPAGLDHRADLGQVQVHGGGVAAGQNARRTLAVLRADSAEDVGGGVALILWCGGSAAAPCPTTGDAVLLADPGLVGEPDLYRVEADAPFARDACQRGREVFLNVSMAPAAWAWCFGRAESLR